jgi:hypothetical protein
MTHTPAELDAWVESLVAEARLDLVFLWNIAKGSFGGSNKAPDEEALEAVVGRLIANGCSVGFGDPDSASWRVPGELRVAAVEVPGAILRLWRENRSENEFLVFAIRGPSQGRVHEG